MDFDYDTTLLRAFRGEYGQPNTVEVRPGENNGYEVVLRSGGSADLLVPADEVVLNGATAEFEDGLWTGTVTVDYVALRPEQKDAPTCKVYLVDEYNPGEWIEIDTWTEEEEAMFS